jgi:hypothetical protein
MPLYASNKGNTEFEPTPAGPQHIICCDVVDLGMVLNQKFAKMQHKCQLRWQSEHVIPKTGKPFLLIKRYTLSLNEKASLRKDIEAWFGRLLTDEEAMEFDIEKLLDKVAFVNVVHAKTAGKTYANIASIMPALPNAPIMSIRDYERVSARVGYKPPEYATVPQSEDEPPPHDDADRGPEDDPIPF